MRQTWMFAVALALLFLYGTAQDEDLSKVEMKVVKVSGKVYMLQGAGGNIGASVGEDGIVIVDDEFAPLAQDPGRAQKHYRQTGTFRHQHPLASLTIPAATNPLVRLRPSSPRTTYASA